ncbi:hypothetical protein EOD10_16690 [Mesorhizobium sp. M7A.T.Ca.TU.009.01.3.2]|jgi:hypothetical protein|nr:hypothetical protein EOD10_16690 [Mesorhizobium sp. M7A.T.Ca.TU.009.01.3.2]RUU81410.1 hypothetical protein EOC06_08450 [Mesorhizobium sp. M7A.F.Ca.MR.362.00.0.0]RUV08210.1 hypothetical protein EOD00_18940 [Mesorhizobium sp. M7A.T.Ca.TU.009.01.3.1]RUV38110.1 hypothetical protein EOB49_08975 [Mesorhizobium sp. M7A.F.Ca.MR.148.00.0.0]RWN90877.1 MAG: hypothetical protein EOS05_24040 [Mesorhizobium sp.]
MTKLTLSSDYYIVSDADGLFQHGEIFHISRNKAGGSVSTRVGRFHTWRPQLHPEGYFPHSRLDCHVDDDPLAPEPSWLARTLLDALIQQGEISEPIWLGWHKTKELDGEERGQVFDLD